MTIQDLKQSARRLLEDNILPFWLDKMQDTEHGGFYGRMDGHNRLDPKADKGAILNARILWAFSAAYRVLKEMRDERLEIKDLLKAATRAKDYFIDHFIDREQGGVYWSVHYMGRPKEIKKQTYAIGFAIYGLSEYARATGDEAALQTALSLFGDIERHAFDAQHVGYIEALTRDWQPIDDMRLSDKDENGSRTMNTHLHILEPYTNLLLAIRASEVKSEKYELPLLKETVEGSLRRLISLFTEHFLNPRTRHLDLFFNDEWQSCRNIESYGHDIEAAWLLTEALEVLGDEELKTKTMPIVSQIAHASEEGLLPDGSMIHERKRSLTDGQWQADNDRHWWVQCENVIGQLNQYQHFHDEQALQKALACYQYIEKKLVDHEHGEWYWSRRPDNTINHDEDKAGPWKCPYHNSRMCLEIIEREL